MGRAPARLVEAGGLVRQPLHRGPRHEGDTGVAPRPEVAPRWVFHHEQAGARAVPSAYEGGDVCHEPRVRVQDEDRTPGDPIAQMAERARGAEGAGLLD